MVGGIDKSRVALGYCLKVVPPGAGRNLAICRRRYHQKRLRRDKLGNSRLVWVVVFITPSANFTLVSTPKVSTLPLG
jgi:hypothetical protein